MTKSFCCLAVGLFALPLILGCTLGDSELYRQDPPQSSRVLPPDGPGQPPQEPETDGGTRPRNTEGGITQPIPELAGTWAEKRVLATIDTLPGIGQVEGASTLVSRLEIEQNGPDLTVKATTCSISINSGSTVVETMFPDAFVRSIGVRPRTAKLTPEAEGWTLMQPQIAELDGVSLDNPNQDVLPTDPNDTHVFDQDQDGRPGVTLRIGGIITGELYLVRRIKHAFRAIVTSNDAISGLVQAQQERSTLGADNAILIANPFESVTDPNAAKSYGRLTRVDAALDCAGIVNNSATIFADGS